MGFKDVVEGALSAGKAKIGQLTTEPIVAIVDADIQRIFKKSVGRSPAPEEWEQLRTAVKARIAEFEGIIVKVVDEVTHKTAVIILPPSTPGTVDG